MSTHPGGHRVRCRVAVLFGIYSRGLYGVHGFFYAPKVPRHRDDPAGTDRPEGLWGAEKPAGLVPLGSRRGARLMYVLIRGTNGAPRIITEPRSLYGTLTDSDTKGSDF